MVYAGPENRPTCCPVTMATVPGRAEASSSETLSPFWADRAFTIAARLSSG